MKAGLKSDSLAPLHYFSVVHESIAWSSCSSAELASSLIHEAKLTLSSLNLLLLKTKTLHFVLESTVLFAHISEIIYLRNLKFLIMKHGNNKSNCNTCSCVILQLHLLSSLKRVFPERGRVFSMCIMVYIALLASFSLKNLLISVNILVLLCIGIEVVSILIRHLKDTQFPQHTETSMPFPMQSF